MKLIKVFNFAIVENEKKVGMFRKRQSLTGVRRVSLPSGDCECHRFPYSGTETADEHVCIKELLRLSTNFTAFYPSRENQGPEVYRGHEGSQAWR